MVRDDCYAILDFSKKTFYKPKHPSLLVNINKTKGHVLAKGISKDVHGDYLWKEDNRKVLGFSSGSLIVSKTFPAAGNYPILSDGEEVFKYGKIALVQNISQESAMKELEKIETPKSKEEIGVTLDKIIKV